MESLIRNTVDASLKEMGLRYKSNNKFFHVIIENDDAEFHFRIIGDEKKELLVTIGYFPVKVSRSNLDRMYKFVNDRNYKTTVGAFLIDSDDGELIFRIANNVDGGAINEQIVRMCFLQVVNTLISSYDDIMEEMFGGPRMSFTFAGDEKPDEQ